MIGDDEEGEDIHYSRQERIIILDALELLLIVSKEELLDLENKIHTTERLIRGAVKRGDSV